MIVLLCSVVSCRVCSLVVVVACPNPCNSSSCIGSFVALPLTTSQFDWNVTRRRHGGRVRCCCCSLSLLLRLHVRIASCSSGQAIFLIVVLMAAVPSTFFIVSFGADLTFNDCTRA